MIQIEPIQNLNGFGIGQGQGEYFHSQGMNRSLFGITPKWNVTADANSGGLTGLSLVNWFTQGQISGTSYVYGYDSAGHLFRSTLGLTTWTSQRSVGTSHGNGMIFDQKNRLLYATDQYLGMTSDGSSFNDTWKDFGASFSTSDYRPMDTYEDWVLIGNVNQVAVLNVTDDSFNADGLDLPDGFKIRCIKSGANGALIGANFNNRGVLILWQPDYTRSIAPWIWRNANIRSIVPTDDGWIVFTTRGIYQTNGYSIQPLVPRLPDDLYSLESVIANLLPQGAEILNNKLVFWGTNSLYNRKLGGLYIMDLDTKLFEFAPISNGCLDGVSGGAVFFDSNYSTQLSYGSSIPSTNYIGKLLNITPTRAQLISEQLGQSDNEKVAEGVKFAIGFNTSLYFAGTMTFDASVKIYNFKRNLYVYSQANALLTEPNKIQVDGTQTSANKAQVGDELTVLQGANAGQVRHIASIANQGTNTETWTLDSALPNNTEDTVRLVTSPFTLVKKFSLSNLTELAELFFSVQNRIKGKKFLVKILLENIPANVELEIKGGQFIYNELVGKR
jgi:hypothetical protein